MTDIHFIKMHSYGNDFVIIDNRIIRYNFKIDKIKHIANRNYGVGCDQLIVIEDSNIADCLMKIYNIDGSTANMCGNAARCVANIIMQQNNVNKIKLEVGNRILQARNIDEQVELDMGEPSFDWQKIPLSKQFDDILCLPITVGNLKNPSAVSVGNPHMIFLVDELKSIDLDIIGRDLECHEYFPEHTNVTVAQIISKTHIITKVWERGVGQTLACGSAACATFAIAYYKQLVDSEAVVLMPGGNLTLKIKNNHIFMSGSTDISFYGKIII